MYKEHLRPKNKKANNPIFKIQKDMNRQLPKEDIHMENIQTKNMLNIICYQEDAKENHKEIPLHTHTHKLQANITYDYRCKNP